MRLAAPLGLLLLVAAAPAALRAQIQNVRHLTSRQGLPQSQVLSLHQDAAGYLWMGTFGGLSRFDGRDFRTWTAHDGLASNTVVDIVSDEHGVLHVGTRGGGVCTLADDRVRCLDADDGLPNANVHQVLPEDGGVRWLATGGGLVRLQGTRAEAVWTERDGLPSDEVRALARDRAGALWIGTARGLARLTEAGLEQVHAERLGGRRILTLARTPRGLVVGAEPGLFVLDGTELREVGGPELQGLTVTGAAVGDDGTVWLSTHSGALRWDDTGITLLSARQGLPQGALLRVLVDREGSVWFGSDRGASQLVPGPFTAYTAAEGLPDPFVRALSEDASGRLWVGTRGGAATLEDDHFTRVALGSLTNSRVYALEPLPDGRMLVGTREGLVVWSPGADPDVLGPSDGLPAPFVTAIRRDGTSAAWIGTSQGVLRWANGRLVPAPDSSLANGFVIALEHDDQGRLWVGLAQGGVLVHDGVTTRRMGAAEGFSDLTVWSIRRGAGGTVWLGTNGDGAFGFRGDSVTRLGPDEGLSDPFVWQVLPDRQGRVWAYTSRGLDRWENGRFVHYGRSHGLLDLEGAAGAALVDSHGALWFGTAHGLHRYDAHGEARNPLPPPVRIERASLDGGERLAPGARVESGLAITFDVGALTYRDPSAVRYRWRLGERWSEPSATRSMSWGGLAPGPYRLEVLAINEDGVASAEPAAFGFHVLPRWWQTWWARALVGLALALVVVAVPALRTRHLEVERRRLGTIIAERTHELESQNRRLEREVAERSRAEQALRASEQRIRDIVEHSTNLFYVHDPDHELLYLSPQARRFFDGDVEECMRRWTDFLTDNPMNREGLASTERALRTGEAQPPYELELAGLRDRVIRVEVNEAPVVRDGRTVAIVGALTDVTETRRAEHARQVLEEQLVQARKMEAVGQLAGGVAHDFNNLLTSILGHTEFLEMEAEATPWLAPDLREIRRAGERAAGLVSQLLAFGRRQIVQPTVLDLNAVLRDTTTMLARLIGANVALASELHPEPLPVRADRTQLEQIVVNLAVNARDAMPDGGRLTLRTAAVHRDACAPGAPATWAALIVSDDGSGIDAATRERIFEPFFTTKEVGKGTGLGLATVYGIVQQNAGHIEVESEPGRGTTFRILLPLSEAQIERGRDVSPHGEADGPRPPAGPRPVVLVVEDEAGVRCLVSRALRGGGFDVIEAHDGASALAASRAYDGSIDLLLTDLVMPGASGRVVADTVSRERPGLPVLFISGYSSEALGRPDGLPHGSRLLQKPFDGTTLLREVCALLAPAGGARS